MSYELSDSDRLIVERVHHADLSTGDVAAMRVMHQEALERLRGRLVAAQRAVAMRELALELLGEARV